MIFLNFSLVTLLLGSDSLLIISGRILYNALPYKRIIDIVLISDYLF